jgi:hypothetical protein
LAGDDEDVLADHLVLVGPRDQESAMSRPTCTNGLRKATGQVPGIVTIVDAFTLRDNGKVDRSRLLGG